LIYTWKLCVLILYNRHNAMQTTADTVDLIMKQRCSDLFDFAEMGLSSAIDNKLRENINNLDQLSKEVNVRGAWKRTPLHWACMSGQVTTVKKLLEFGASPENRDKEYGWTPLHFAVRYHQFECVKVLLLHDIKLREIQDFSGLKPIDLSTDPEVTELLTSCKSNDASVCRVLRLLSLLDLPCTSCDALQKLSLELQHIQEKVKIEIANQQREQQRGDSIFSCVVCVDRPKNILLLPCNHLGVCSECVHTIDGVCPICKQKFQDKLKVFL